MTFWIIILSILAFFYLISLIRFKFIIEYNDELRMDLRIMHFIRIPITPKKEKKIKLSHYSPKNIAKQEKKQLEKSIKKEQKKIEKKQKKQEKKQRKKEHPEEFKPKRSLSENISLITDVLRVFLKRFFKHFRIDFSRIHISLVGEDAAQTAILYGVVSQSVSYLLKIMKSIKTVSPPDLSDVSVTPDWVGERTRVDIKIAFSMRVGNVFDILGHVIRRAVVHLFQDMKKKNMSSQHKGAPSAQLKRKKSVVSKTAPQKSK